MVPWPLAFSFLRLAQKSWRLRDRRASGTRRHFHHKAFRTFALFSDIYTVGEKLEGTLLWCALSRLCHFRPILVSRYGY